MAFLSTFSRVHVIGAGGIGISAVAKLLKYEGKTVSGSDVGENETTRELVAAGIPVAKGHAAENLPEGTDLVVFSSAVPPVNPERAEARRRGIRELTYFEFVGEFSKERFTIAVSGTNGKSTTTAMLGLMLERAGFDPTVIVGSKVKSFPDRNLRLGKSRYFVIEACEHEAHMLFLRPQVIVLTNIEEDHLDFYRDLQHIKDTFQEYVEKLPEDGKLILNADDRTSFFGLQPTTAFTTYGIVSPADYLARNVTVGSGVQTFEVVHKAKRRRSLGKFDLHVPGMFNVANAMAAITAALELGVPADVVRASLAEFSGIWRRFEKVGERDGAAVISDYGHHPTAIRGTVEAAKEFYPDRRIILAFQPHQHTRTAKLFNEFVASFDGVDVLVLAEIYDVAGREASEYQGVSSYDLVKAVKERDADRKEQREVLFAASVSEAQALIEQRSQSGDVIIVMGAGDIYTIAGKLVG